MKYLLEPLASQFQILGDYSCIALADSYPYPLEFCFFPNIWGSYSFPRVAPTGPHDSASVSGLASQSGCLGPPTLSALGRMSLHLSHPTCLPLWVPWAA